MQRACATAWYAHARPCSHECNFPKHVERILPLKIISVARSTALENDNKAARQVYKGDREPPRIRKDKLCRTMHKRSKRKGLKFLLRQ